MRPISRTTLGAATAGTTWTEARGTLTTERTDADGDSVTRTVVRADDVR
ncbi:hypothetical protein [Streptomyces sp. NPDC048623]